VGGQLIRVARADGDEGTAMTQAAEFRQYAEEALREASATQSENDKQALIKLARLWSRAALSAESSSTLRMPSNQAGAGV
jgi:tRNA C32,U32 (ribose-2'-O)-methylase TrmJ